jgi:AbrB family looped-hinge helix DNA binding protein
MRETLRAGLGIRHHAGDSPQATIAPIVHQSLHRRFPSGVTVVKCDMANFPMSITTVGKNYNGPMRITSKGQVTIPQGIREHYGLMPQTDVEFIERDGVVILAPAATVSKPDRADQLLARLRGSAQRTLTTDEIMQLSRSYDDD